MRIQGNVPRNPYATLALMTRQGPLGTDGSRGDASETRAPLARRPLPGISHSAPVLRSQLLARVERYEGLGEQLTALRTALSRFAPPTPLSGSGAAGLPLGMPSASTTGSSASDATPTSSSQGTASSGSTGTSSGVAAPSGGTRTVSHPAVMLGTQRISLTSPTPGTEGTPATRATLTTAALELNPTETTQAELKGGAITLGDGKAFTRFGKMTLNGKEITFSPFKGDTAEEAAQFIATRINQFKAQTGVEASVDSETGDRLVLKSLTAGSQGTIAITQIHEDGANSGSLGFSEGDSAQGVDGASDLGEVTINGIKTQFGIQKHASVQDALAYMVGRLNEEHDDLDATVDGNRLVLTSKATGSDAMLRVDAVTNGTVKLNAGDSSNGFTAGAIAKGKDAEPGQAADPGVTDFGQVTINGIETVFGRLDNRDHNDATAALYLAERINETNATVRATIEDGRLKLTSTATGTGATIRIDSVTTDSDGNRDNDREVGFVAEALASGSETKESSGSGGASGSSTVSTATVGAVSSDTSGTRGGSAASGEASGLTETERTDLASQVQEWAQLTNDYLSKLDERSEEHPQGRGDLKAFSRTIGAMVKQDSALAEVGISVSEGRVSLDEETFLRAMEQDPHAALGAVQQFRDTLDPLLASQAHAMDFMREVSDATLARVPEISQAKTMLYKLEQRSKEVSGWLEGLEKLMPGLSEQGDRLSKLGETEDESEDEDAEERKLSGLQEESKPKAWPGQPEAPTGLAALRELMKPETALP